MPTHNVSTMSPRAYISAVENGRYSTTIAPRTLWRQRIQARHTQGEASTVSVVATVDALHDGEYIFSFFDVAGDEVARVTVEVGMGTPADEAAMATAIAAAFEAEADLDDHRASATADDTAFDITFLPGMALRLVLEAGITADDITASHIAAVDLNALRPTNAFPRNMLREGDAYVQVLEAFPADTVVDVAGDSGTVIAEAALDAEGDIDGTASAFSRGDNIETEWQPVATLELGDDPFPTEGLVEVRVPKSPLLTPQRLE